MDLYHPGSGMFSKDNPGINKFKDVKHTSKLVLYIDSRDRDVTAYPSANDFVFKIAKPVRAVKSIILTSMFCPIVADTTATSFVNVVPVITQLPENTIVQCKESIGFPTGVLGVLPLVPLVAGSNYTSYSSVGSKKGHGGSWKIDFPIAMSQLYELHIQLLTWGGNVAGNGWGGSIYPPILYPLADESTSSRPAKGNNYYMTIEIEHQI
jgi:hypothetical protein